MYNAATSELSENAAFHVQLHKWSKDRKWSQGLTRANGPAENIVELKQDDKVNIEDLRVRWTIELKTPQF